MDLQIGTQRQTMVTLSESTGKLVGLAGMTECPKMLAVQWRD